MTATPDEAAVPARALLPLRVSVLAVQMCGLWALAAADLLEPVAAVLGGALTVAASQLAVVYGSPRAARVRRWVALACATAICLRPLRGVLSGYAEGPAVTSVGPLLALLVTGLAFSHALVVAARRDLLVALSLGVVMVVLAAGLAPGAAVAPPLLLAWCGAVLALWVAARPTTPDQAAALVTVGAQRPPGLAVEAAVAVSAAVLTGLLGFLLLPQPAGLGARSALLGGSDTGGAGGGRTATAYASGDLDLTARGRLPDSPVLDVPADSPPLWRGTVLDTYTGQGWSAQAVVPRRLVDADTELLPSPLDPLPGGPPRTDVVHVRTAAYEGVVVAPGAVDNVAVAGVALQRGDGSVLVGSPAGGPVPPYTVTSRPPVTDPGRLDRADGADLVDPRWLALPTTVPPRVVDLARELAATDAPRYEQVQAVETYLRTHERYQLDSPLPAPGADAVDDFLFVSHDGFCEQFASAEVVLLRSAGVPARLATGFAYGVPDAPGRRLFRASDAHAWVEVWYPGVGWSPSDPTAGAALASTAPSVLDRLAALLTAPARDRALAALAVAAFAAVVAAAFALVMRRRLRRGHRDDGGGWVVDDQGGRPLLRAFRELERTLRRGGRPRLPSETVRELSRRLPTGPSPGSEHALARVEQQCYAADAPPLAEAVEAAAVLTAVAAELRAGPVAPEHG